MKQKRKDKNLAEKQAMEDLKEIKNYITQGKATLDKAFRNQQIEEALAIFNRALNKAATNQQIALFNQLYHLRGQCYFRLAQFDLAEKDFQEAITISDDRSKAILYNCLGKCKAKMALRDPSQYEEAAKCFEKVLEFSNHTDGEGFFNLGLAYRKIKTQPVSKAIKQFTDSLKYLKASDQYQALVQRGICYREVQELQNSIEDFIRACQMRKEDPQPHFNLGLSYLLNNMYDSAFQKLSFAIQLNKTQPQYYNYKALALYLSGQYEQSLFVFGEALKLYEARNSKDGQFGECWYNKGNAFLNLNRQQEALQCFSKTQQFNIDEKMRIKLLYAQGRALELKSQQQAIDKFTSCLQMIHQNKSNDLYLSALFHLARNQQMHRQCAKAIDSLTLILQSQCRDKCVYEERGKAYLKNENYQEALKDFEAVVAFNQNYSDAYYYRGKARTCLGDIQLATQDFFRAIQLGSQKNQVFNGISEAYMRGGKFQKALIYSNISLQKQPKNQQFLIQRSRIYLELNQYEKGIKDLSNALAVNQKNPLVYYRRGLAYYKNKQFSATIQDLEKSLKYSPSKNIQIDIYYHIGISYANLEQYQSALQPLTKALALDPQPKYFHERAKCQILLDQNLNALKDLNEVIKLQPENAFAYFRRGFAHKALKLYDQAAQDFMRARELSPEDPRLIINKKQIYQTKYRKLCEAGEEQ